MKVYDNKFDNTWEIPASILVSKKDNGNVSVIAKTYHLMKEFNINIGIKDYWTLRHVNVDNLYEDIEKSRKNSGIATSVTSLFNLFEKSYNNIPADQRKRYVFYSDNIENLLQFRLALD